MFMFEYNKSICKNALAHVFTQAWGNLLFQLLPWSFPKLRTFSSVCELQSIRFSKMVNWFYCRFAFICKLFNRRKCWLETCVVFVDADDTEEIELNISWIFSFISINPFVGCFDTLKSLCDQNTIKIAFQMFNCHQFPTQTSNSACHFNGTQFLNCINFNLTAIKLLHIIKCSSFTLAFDFVICGTFTQCVLKCIFAIPKWMRKGRLQRNA